MESSSETPVGLREKDTWSIGTNKSKCSGTGTFVNLNTLRAMEMKLDSVILKKRESERILWCRAEIVSRQLLVHRLSALNVAHVKYRIVVLYRRQRTLISNAWPIHERDWKVGNLS